MVYGLEANYMCLSNNYTVVLNCTMNLTWVSNLLGLEGDCFDSEFSGSFSVPFEVWTFMTYMKIN